MSRIISPELSLASGNAPEIIHSFRPPCMTFATFSYTRAQRASVIRKVKSSEEVRWIEGQEMEAEESMRRIAIADPIPAAT